MRIPTSMTDSNVGREDRLVRGCIALSLLLLGGFSMAGAPQLSFVSVLFVVMGLYFAVTASFGTDPSYGFAGIDTRTDLELAEIDQIEDFDEVDLDLALKFEEHQEYGADDVAAEAAWDAEPQGSEDREPVAAATHSTEDPASHEPAGLATHTEDPGRRDGRRLVPDMDDEHLAPAQGAA